MIKVMSPFNCLSYEVQQNVYKNRVPASHNTLICITKCCLF